MDRIEDLRENFEHLSGCCLHNVTWNPGEVTEIILFADNENGVWRALDGYGGGPETSALAIVRLGNEYGLLSSGEDYTGHGCQCDSFTGRYANLNTLFQMGIDEWEREEIRALLP